MRYVVLLGMFARRGYMCPSPRPCWRCMVGCIARLFLPALAQYVVHTTRRHRPWPLASVPRCIEFRQELTIWMSVWVIHIQPLRWTVIVHTCMECPFGAASVPARFMRTTLDPTRRGCSGHGHLCMLSRLCHLLVSTTLAVRAICEPGWPPRILDCAENNIRDLVTLTTVIVFATHTITSLWHLAAI